MNDPYEHYQSASAVMLREALRDQEVVWTPETGWTDFHPTATDLSHPKED